MKKIYKLNGKRVLGPTPVSNAIMNYIFTSETRVKKIMAEPFDHGILVKNIDHALREIGVHPIWSEKNSYNYAYLAGFEIENEKLFAFYLLKNES